MNRMAPLLILFAAILWGTTGTVQALAPDHAHPIAIGASRLAIGGFFLLFILLISRSLSLKNWPIKATLLSALSIAIYQPLFFSAVMVTGVAVGTVVTIGSAPILSGVLEWLFLKTRPSRIWWYSTILSIIGCVLLFANSESVQVDPLGILLSLSAGLMFASYTLVSRSVVQVQPSLSAVAVIFSLSGLILSPFLFIFDMSWITEINGLVASLHLGVVATALAYFMFAQGLKQVTSSTAVTLTLAEPLTAAILGVFLLGEVLSVTSWIGMVFIFLGIVVLVTSTRKRIKKTAVQ
ncbi:MAG TPA: EamA family transporter [Aliicoccus persicus]|uniref:EamA family transporter n=1 Tax=Aliicoccus persicus TaxID=930138 RepID=A0A921DWN2_9STAP|nr:EamA family transporter [Aliicoccus persicus]